jgi:hypothetical protein
VRKVNADEKRQAAELIELDGGDLRREPLALLPRFRTIQVRPKDLAVPSGATSACGKLIELGTAEGSSWRT